MHGPQNIKLIERGFFKKMNVRICLFPFGTVEGAGGYLSACMYECTHPESLDETHTMC
jgi:hypothetical protein